jgi:hypothetical protein
MFWGTQVGCPKTFHNVAPKSLKLDLLQLVLSLENLRLEFEALLLYYSLAREASSSVAPYLRNPRLSVPMSHSDDNHSY